MHVQSCCFVKNESLLIFVVLIDVAVVVYKTRV